MRDRTTVYATRAEWLAARSLGLGASEAAPLLGHSPFRGPWDVVAAKRRGELAEDPDDVTDDGDLDADDPLVRGTLLEPAVLAMYGHDTGVRAVPAGEWFGGPPGSLAITRHPTLPWLSASLDAVLLDGSGVVEAKTDASRSGWKWAASGTEVEAGPALAGVLPDHCAIQGMVQLACADVSWVDFALLLGGFKFRRIRLHRNARAEDVILRDLTEAWERYVVGGEDPDPDASDACVQALRARYAQVDDGARRAADDEVRLMLRIAAAKAADRDAKEARASLLARMAGASRLWTDAAPTGAARGARRDSRGALTVYGF